MSKEMTVGSSHSAEKYELLGIDWKEKRLGVPTWGWGAALAAAVYYFGFRKKR